MSAARPGNIAGGLANMFAACFIVSALFVSSCGFSPSCHAAESEDRPEAGQSAKPDSASAPDEAAGDGEALACKLKQNPLPEGGVRAVVVLENRSPEVVHLNKPSVGTVTWILAGGQIIGAHPGQPPEQIQLGAGELFCYKDTLDLPPDNRIVAAEVAIGTELGLLRCE